MKTLFIEKQEFTVVKFCWNRELEVWYRFDGYILQVIIIKMAVKDVGCIS